MLPFTSTSIAVLVFVTLQRVGELLYAHRNERRLKARGAIEHAPEHYWAIVALHSAWLAGLWLLAPQQPINLVWLTIFIGLQGLRVWVLATLKDRWTTRIIVLPGAPLIKTGLYRLIPHPNYAIVAAEVFSLPMAFGLPTYAVLFSLINAFVLMIRIRAENRALRAAGSSLAEPVMRGSSAEKSRISDDPRYVRNC
jgi:methyltransferase